jgi:hypothetical protein
MKKYRLKQWYPSLLKDVRVGDIITENGQHYKGLTYKCISYRVEIWQLHPDFWELIEEEKPLFVTEDGVDIFLGHSYILIDKEFIKHKQTASNIVYTEYFKKFKHESNADEYIWRNKPLFSYEDMRIALGSQILTNDDLIMRAKERAKL